MHNCINIVKISIKNNKKGFIILNNKKNLNILRELIKINLIKYVVIKNEYVIGYINYLNNKPVFNNIVNFYKTSNKKFIKIKDLKKINKKYGWMFLLSTNKGILNSVDAITLNIGGLIIAQMWN